MSALDELITNITELKTILSTDGEYSICRTDRKSMNLGDEMFIGSILEKIDSAIKDAPAELAELKSENKELKDENVKLRAENVSLQADRERLTIMQKEYDQHITSLMQLSSELEEKEKLLSQSGDEGAGDCMSDYLTEAQLRKIAGWPYMDFQGLMQYIHELWHWKLYWEQNGEGGLTYTLHTGGWSGNEDLINAMMNNQIWWSLYWQESRRGGHYVFCRHHMVDGDHITDQAK